MKELTDEVLKCETLYCNDDLFKIIVEPNLHYPHRTTENSASGNFF
jgi:hypothetical protein